MPKNENSTSSSGSENSSVTRRRRGRPPATSASAMNSNEIAYTSARRNNISKSLDASANTSSSYFKNDDDDDGTDNSSVTPARPTYTSRGDSMARGPPAMTCPTTQPPARSTSPPPLPPAIFSGTFDVPTSTPHISHQSTNGLRIVSPSRNGGADGITATSVAQIPSSVMYARQSPPPPPPTTHHSSSHFLSPPNATHHHTYQTNPPSVTVREQKEDLTNRTSNGIGVSTVKIEQPSSAPGTNWFNSTPVVGNGNGNVADSSSRHQTQNHTHYSQHHPQQQQQQPLPPPHYSQNVYVQQNHQNHPMAMAQSPSTARLINAPSRSPVLRNADHLQRFGRGMSVSQTPYHPHRGYYGDVYGSGGGRAPQPPAPYRQDSMLRNVAPSGSNANNVNKQPKRPNYLEMTFEQQSDARKKLFDKFLILQRSFPAWNIPLPAEESSLDLIHDLYESYVKQITIHSNSTQYKIVLVLMFIGIEFASSRFGVDLSGYAEMQIRSMHRYEGVLLELGEKYTSEGSGEMPVEARIFVLALIQAGIFFVAKYVEKWTGAKGMSRVVHSLMDSMVDQAPAVLGGGESGPRVDAQGFPIAPGTEEAIAAIDDDDVNAAIAAAAGGNASAGASRPPIDLGGMLSGLFGGGGGGSPLGGALGGALGSALGGGGGGGLDVANLVGTAMKFINQGGNEQTAAKAKTSPQRQASPPPVRVSPTSPPNANANISPSRSQISPGRNGVPRKAPVFTAE